MQGVVGAFEALCRLGANESASLEPARDGRVSRKRVIRVWNTHPLEVTDSGMRLVFSEPLLGSLQRPQQ